MARAKSRGDLRKRLYSDRTRLEIKRADNPDTLGNFRGWPTVAAGPGPDYHQGIMFQLPVAPGTFMGVERLLQEWNSEPR